MIPLQQNLDLNRPDEMFLWALVAMPGPHEDAPLMMSPDRLRLVSKRLFDCGFRFHPELQTVKYLPPAMETHWLASAQGNWVPVDAEVPAEVSAPNLAAMSHAEKLEIVRQLEEEGYQLPGRVAESVTEARVMGGE